MKLYDDSFYVKEEQIGTWNSVDLDGKKIVTSYTENDCVNATRYYLKMLQENMHGH